ncbi:hypothetical protein ISE1_3387 [plant metagenome]|uniref:Uncharacterized protein n=1 Tax=plant metagenome TaxID=1297885 RepID=A0A484SFT2_9ZZZZ
MRKAVAVIIEAPPCLPRSPGRLAHATFRPPIVRRRIVKGQAVAP